MIVIFKRSYNVEKADYCFTFKIGYGYYARKLDDNSYEVYNIDKSVVITLSEEDANYYLNLDNKCHILELYLSGLDWYDKK